jgi:hypothetical protein
VLRGLAQPVDDLEGAGDVEKIGVPEDATPAFLDFNFLSHILGRAILTVTAEITG